MINIALIIVLMALGTIIIVFFRQLPIEKGKDVPSSITCAIDYKTAIHEAGHLIAAWSCTSVTKVSKAYINNDGGRVEYLMTDNGSLDNDWCRLVIALSGMSAEVMLFGKVCSSGSRSDLMTSFEITKDIIKANPDYAPPLSSSFGKSLNFSEIYVDKITEKEFDLLSSAYCFSKEILAAHKEKLYHIAIMLHELRVITEDHAAQALGDRSCIKIVGAFKPTFIYPKYDPKDLKWAINEV